VSTYSCDPYRYLWHRAWSLVKVPDLTRFQRNNYNNNNQHGFWLSMYMYVRFRFPFEFGFVSRWRPLSVSQFWILQRSLHIQVRIRCDRWTLNVIILPCGSLLPYYLFLRHSCYDRGRTTNTYIHALQYIHTYTTTFYSINPFVTFDDFSSTANCATNEPFWVCANGRWSTLRTLKQLQLPRQRRCAFRANTYTTWFRTELNCEW